jgi:hypothetical protein
VLYFYRRTIRKMSIIKSSVHFWLKKVNLVLQDKTKMQKVISIILISLASLALNLLKNKIIASYAGSALIGRLSIFQQYSNSMIPLLVIGGGSFLQSSLMKDKCQKGEVFFGTFCKLCIVSSFCAIVGATVFFFLDLLLLNFLEYLLLVIFCLLLAAAQLANAILFRFKKFSTAQALPIVSSIVASAAIVVMKFTNEISIVALETSLLCGAAAVLLINCCIILKRREMFVFFVSGMKRFSWSVCKEILATGLILTATVFSTTFLQTTFRQFAFNQQGSREFGFYVTAISTGQVVFSICVTALFSYYINYLSSVRSLLQIRKTIWVFVLSVALLGAFAISCFYFFGSSFLKIFLSQEFSAQKRIFVFAIIAEYIRTVGMVFSVFVLIKRSKVFASSEFVFSILFPLVSYTIIKLGHSLTTVIQAQSFIYLIYLFYFFIWTNRILKSSDLVFQPKSES